MSEIIIKETTKEDLENVKELWNNGEVMYYVGFPKGLFITMDKLEKWLERVNQDDLTKHYSIFTDELGYCGETFYHVDTSNDLATLDIKLFPKAQGKGVAKFALNHAINQVFSNKLAKKAYVDPNPDNKKAWKFYTNLGFKELPRPEFLGIGESYLEISVDNWHNE